MWKEVSGTRLRGGCWRRSRWDVAICRWRRTARAYAWKAQIRPTPRVRRCSSCSQRSNSRAESTGPPGEAVDRLAGLAANSGDDRVNAWAELATGQVCAAEGDERATSHLQTALERFSTLDLPLEAGRARLELARTLGPRAPAAAVAEARLALTTFEQLGAVRDADRAADLLRGLGSSGRSWPRRSGDADEPGNRGAGARRGRVFQRRDRQAPLHQPANSGAPRCQHPVQARACAAVPRRPPMRHAEPPEDP